MAEKFENTNGAASGTEFERSIARSSATSSDTSFNAARKAPLLVDGHGGALRRDQTNAADDQLRALKTELENLKHSLANIATKGKGLASEKAEMTIADVEEALKRNVFASVGIATLVGYLWGRTR